MDYVPDGLADGRWLRCLNVVDDFTKQYPVIEVDSSLPDRRAVSVHERQAELRGLPKSVTVDDDSKFAGKVLNEWTYHQGLRLSFIPPGKPQQMLTIGSCNGRVRDECLNEH